MGNMKKILKYYLPVIAINNNNYRKFKPSNKFIDNKSGFQTPPTVKTIAV